MKKNFVFVLLIHVVFIAMLPISSGNISPPEVNEINRKMVSITSAQNVEKLVTRHLVSISGYAHSVRQRLTLGKKSVNINIADH